MANRLGHLCPPCSFSVAAWLLSVGSALRISPSDNPWIAVLKRPDLDVQR